MKVYGFGAASDDCYLFSTLNADDDWTITHDPIASVVGGRDGAFDYYGDDNFKVKPATISKTFTIVPALTQFTGTGTAAIAIDDTTIDGSGSLFLDELAQGDIITIDGHAFTIDYVETQTRAYSLTASEYEITQHAYTIDPASLRDSIHYSELDTPLDALRAATLAIDEDKLWFAMRDGSYRWCWAKCISLSMPEKIDSRLDIEVSIGFYCREGLMYNEDQHTDTETAAGDFDLTNAGNYPAILSCDLTAGDSSATAFSLTSSEQAWAFAGTLAATKHLIVDPAKYTAENDGADAYDDLTITDKAALWMYLPASATETITSAITGGGTGWEFTVSWYDTWIM